jgi:tetratricopeptide (TPR) repeat protein
MVLLGLLLFVAVACLGPMQETDLFFRLKAGEEFLSTGTLVRRNLFSFTYPDHPYLDPAWLFDAGVALAFRVGGFPAVVIAKTAVVAAVFAGAYCLVRRRGASAVSAALLLAAAAFAMRDRFVERPHIFSLAGEVALLALLPHLPRRIYLALFVGLIVIWANLHAGAFLGPALIGAAGVGVVADAYSHRRPELARMSWPYLVAVALGTVALMATPVGPGIFRYLSFHSDVFALHPVDEFRSPTWRSDPAGLLFAFASLATLGLAALRRVAVPWRDLLPVVLLAALAARHVRFGSDFILVAAITVAPVLSPLARTVPTLAGFTRLHPARPARLVTLALVTAALAPRLSEAAHQRRWPSLDVDRSALPLHALAFVEQHGLRERMYNDFETGAYLLWEGYPRHRVFTDPRMPAYPREFHQLLGRFDVDRTEWTAAMDRYGVESALIDYASINRRAAWWDPEAWALIFRSYDTRVFVRRLPRFRDLIARFEIPATFSFTVENGARTEPLAEPPSHSPVPACEWQARLADVYFDLDQPRTERAVAASHRALATPGCLEPALESSTAAWLGSLDLAAGRMADALVLLDRALGITPDDTATLTNRALALESLGRHNEARITWARIAQLAVGTPLGARARERAVISP